MTDEEIALLRAILADPDNDLPRLVYADWLEERAGQVDCTACEGDGRHRMLGRTVIAPTRCTRCDGEGWRSDGWAERAEYIRISCEFDARYPEECVVDDSYFAALLVRMIELDNRHGETWWARETCGFVTRLRCLFDGLAPEGPSAFVRRGFIQEVRCPLAWWIGCPCESCGGRGYDPYSLDPVRPDACPDCGGAGRTDAHGPALVRSNPIERVTITDREPMRSLNGWYAFHQTYSWGVGMEVGETTYLVPPGIGVGYWGRAESAMNALGSDCLAWVLVQRVSA